MAKKLVSLLLTFTIIACSSISIYANVTDDFDNTTLETTEEKLDNTGNDGKAEVGQREKGETEKAHNEGKKGNAKTTQKKEIKKESKKDIRYRKGLASYIRYINPSVSYDKSQSMAGEFIKKGRKYNLDPKVLMAIAKNESTFYTNAKSPYGYKGLMQTSDALARKYGYKPSSMYRASASIDVGARYLRAMKNQFGTYTKALSAYAYGSGTVSSGRYSTSLANRLLRTRKEITRYLEKRNYI